MMRTNLWRYFKLLCLTFQSFVIYSDSSSSRFFTSLWLFSTSFIYYLTTINYFWLMYLHNIPYIFSLTEKFYQSNFISLWLFLIFHAFKGKLSSLCLSTVVSWFLLINSGIDSLSTDEVESHLEMGKQMLARGQYNDALSHYHAAVGKLDLNIFLGLR